MVIESVHFSRTAAQLCPKLPEVIWLVMNSLPSIVASAKDSDQLDTQLTALLSPYKEGGEFSISFVDPMSRLPVDIMSAHAVSALVDYNVKVH